MNKLKRSENELSEFVLQQIPYGILLEDINRKISSVNNEFLTIFNLHSISKELIGLDCNIMLEQSKAKFLDPNTFQKFINDSVIKITKLGGLVYGWEQVTPVETNKGSGTSTLNGDRLWFGAVKTSPDAGASSEYVEITKLKSMFFLKICSYSIVGITIS